MQLCLLCKALIPDTVSEHAATAESNFRVVISEHKIPSFSWHQKALVMKLFEAVHSTDEPVSPEHALFVRQISPFEKHIQHV